MTTIYAVACTSYSPPEIDSVWSEEQWAIDKRDLLNKTRHGIHKIFPVVVDSGKFDIGLVPLDDKRNEYDESVEG